MNEVLEFVAVEPVAVKPTTAAKMLDCGLTTIYRMINKGELETVKLLDGDERVIVASIRKRAERAK